METKITSRMHVNEAKKAKVHILAVTKVMSLGLFENDDRNASDPPKLVHFLGSDTSVTTFLENLCNIYRFTKHTTS